MTHFNAKNDGTQKLCTSDVCWQKRSNARVLRQSAAYFMHGSGCSNREHPVTDLFSCCLYDLVAVAGRSQPRPGKMSEAAAGVRNLARNSQDSATDETDQHFGITVCTRFFPRSEVDWSYILQSLMKRFCVNFPMHSLLVKLTRLMSQDSVFSFLLWNIAQLFFFAII